MILLILGISVGLLILGLFIEAGANFDSMAEDVGNVMQIIFGLASVVAAFIAIVLLVISKGNSTIDDRIAMYQEENAKIEQQIDILVKDYQEYESGVFADANSESAITLVSLYPELKADQLVSSQIDIYVANNEQIKRLKLEQINADVVRWWLYFGGK